MTNKTPAQILWEAADIVDQGWTQGRYEDAGSYCAMGALCKTVGVKPESLEAGLNLDLRTAGWALAGVVQDHVPDWNDALDRTATQVSFAMRVAAISLDPSLANIGETIEEVEVVPMTQPLSEPTPVRETPVEEPDRELQPA